MSKQDDDKRMINVDEAMALLPVGDAIHTFRNPRSAMLLGADISRERLYRLINENAETLQIGGPACRRLKHGLVLIDDAGPLFISTDMDKLDLFDPVK